MSVLLVLRHGPTEWTAARRLQGRSDIPLSVAGRAMVAIWRLPDRSRSLPWVTSPLRRCTETAEILRRGTPAIGTPRIEPRLTEMSFGAWEGRSLGELRATHGPAMAELEGRGLDFRAPDGESPRDVQDRLRPWLEALAADSDGVVAVTHKGVIRALYALATGWDMSGKPPQRLLDNTVHEFDLDRTGLRIGTLNIPLRQQATVAGTSP